MKLYDDIKSIIITKNATIEDALRAIDCGKMKIALIVDEHRKLVATLTDGDIRRAFLNGLQMNNMIEDIMYKEPLVCKIEDNKEEMLELAVHHKIYQIPIVDNEGKLVGLEEVTELISPISKKNKVVLMVGGLGTRLRPLTENIPKPMLKVGDKPILETIILNFKKYGFTNIILSVGYKAEVIEEYFGNGSEFGVNIEYIYEEQRMGTAGALSLMREKLNESFFVMNGDLLTNLNFEHMMEFHLLNESIATMAVREYDFQVPYGVVKTDGENIVSIEEKPLHKFFVSGGVYVLKKDVLDFIPDNVFYDMPTLFDKLITENLKTTSFPIHEYWLDIGRMEEFEKANFEYGKVF